MKAAYQNSHVHKIIQLPFGSHRHQITLKGDCHHAKFEKPHFDSKPHMKGTSPLTICSVQQVKKRKKKDQNKNIQIMDLGLKHSHNFAFSF